MFLALIHRLHVPNMIQALKGNHIASFRDPELILQKCKSILPSELLERLKSVLCNYNPTRFQGYTTTVERAEYQTYSNHLIIEKNKSLVQQAMNKEERNKYVVVLPC